jgi:hypothetical protein
MISMKKLGLLVVLLATFGASCDDIFGSKNDSTNEEILMKGK